MIDLIMQCTQCELAYTGEQKRIVAGCRDYVRVVFQLCPDWLALDTITATFRAGEADPVGVPVVDGVCEVPAGVIAPPSFTIGLTGVDADGTVIVSTVVAFSVTAGEAEPGAAEGEDTASIYTLTLQEASRAADAAEAAQAAAEAAKVAAEAAQAAAESGTGGGGAVEAVLYIEQTLTNEQQERARANIGAASLEEILGEIEGELVTDILHDKTWRVGYYNSSGEFVQNLMAEHGTGSTVELIKVTPGKLYNLTYTVPANKASLMWRAIAEYSADGSFLQRSGGGVTGTVDGDTAVSVWNYTVPDNVEYIRVSGRSFYWDGYYDSTIHTLGDMSLIFKMEAADGSGTQSGGRLLPVPTSEKDGQTLVTSGGEWTLVEKQQEAYANPHVRAVNHRGYSGEAPENTLSAYRLSRKMGFDCVECDVSFTSDGVAVLLHDSTVDRTSDGTGDIASLTLEDVRALDFGGWFSDEYAGEQIPTFEEFIILCKRLGLHPYVEIKNTAMSTSQVAQLVETVKRYGMLRNSTWISVSTTALGYVLDNDPCARVGYVTSDTTDATVTWATGTKTDSNEVFIDLFQYVVTSDFVEACAAASVPLEVWTVNSEAELAALDPYVSGYTSDSLRANAVLYDAGMAAS